MKIVFIGTVEFSSRILETLLKLNANVVGIITAHNGLRNSDHADLVPIANKNNISILHTYDINDAKTVTWIKNHNPAVIFCIGWSWLLKTGVLNIPTMGVIGYHPSLLPKNRGHHPII